LFNHTKSNKKGILMSDKLRFIIGAADKSIPVEQLAEADKKIEATKPKASKGRKRESVGEAFVKNAARSIGSQIGRRIIRGVLGSLFGGK
jgi:hypothetical protein